ncbi:DUF5807 family protein [Haloarcula marina]|uniref:DUF5807 family protein n=1 Tax=Haloarcula marina TaxID=2961574 RepID=UPI0020B8B78F|nr:DUF5807 family protein [Halomicroarcula marina]
MQSHEQFIAGNRPGHIMLFQHENATSLPDDASKVAKNAAEGKMIIQPAVMARDLIDKVLVPNISQFTELSQKRQGNIEPYLTSGDCPEANSNHDEDHIIEQLFAFVQPKHNSLGGIYADGDVMHAYARCSCQVHYSDRWVIASK